MIDNLRKEDSRPKGREDGKAKPKKTVKIGKQTMGCGTDVRQPIYCFTGNFVEFSYKVLRQESILFISLFRQTLWLPDLHRERSLPVPWILSGYSLKAQKHLP